MHVWMPVQEIAEGLKRGRYTWDDTGIADFGLQHFDNGTSCGADQFAYNSLSRWTCRIGSNMLDEP